jgi:hypothetical protein
VRSNRHQPTLIIKTNSMIKRDKNEKIETTLEKNLMKVGVMVQAIRAVTKTATATAAQT